MNYRQDIDGLRAIAVLSVVLFHYSNGTSVFSGGYIGVDIFFVISGYLITSIIYKDITNGTYSVLDFYNRRIRRIFPALFTVFISSLIAAFFLSFPSESEFIGKSIASSILFISNILFFSTSSYFDNNLQSNPVLHTWSLSVEEQFYIFFPIVVFIMRSYPQNKRMAVIVFLWVTSFIGSVIMVKSNASAAFYLVPFRAWELLTGSLLALNKTPALNKEWFAELISAVGLIGILFSITVYTKTTTFPGFSALLPCAGAAAIIYAGSIRKTLVYKLIGLKPIRFIGLISYSMYLWHWPLLVFVNQYREPRGAVDKAILLLICLIVAAFSWKFIEQPFRKKTQEPRQTILFAVLAMISVGTLSLSIGYLSKEYWQLPVSVENVLAYQNYSPGKFMSAGTCFLTSGSSSFNNYKKEECLKFAPDKKNVLIVGDSHAAFLVAGLRNTYPKINFLQATSSGCKPTLNASGETRCLDLVNYIFTDYLPKQHVDAIILSGRWKKNEIEQAISTASYLRKYATNVLILGPVPEYDQPLPRVLAKSIANNINEGVFATAHRRAEQKIVDDIFSKQALPPHVTYISTYKAMCPKNCVLWVKNNTPIQFDYGHLTEEGSNYLAEHLNTDLSFVNE